MKFYFDKCSKREEENIYAYFLQVCPNQQDLEQLKRVVPNVESVNDSVLPPRILQSVHGFFRLSTIHPTRLDLSNQWDKNTVTDISVHSNGEKIQTRSVVCFYTIDCKSFNPIEVNPKPYPVRPIYDNDALTSTLSRLKYKHWIGST